MWLRHTVLVSARMGLELLVLAAAIVMAAVPQLRAYAPIAFGLLLGLAALKLYKMARHRKRAGVSAAAVSLWHLVALDYATKWYATQGYLRGCWRGFAQCQECRRSLRAVGIGWTT